MITVITGVNYQHKTRASIYSGGFYMSLTDRIQYMYVLVFRQAITCSTMWCILTKVKLELESSSPADGRDLYKEQTSYFVQTK